MRLGLSLSSSLGTTQTLKPQYIHYLKLLQLPVLQLEQHIQQELEQNPLLEEVMDDEISQDDESAESSILQNDPDTEDFYYTNTYDGSPEQYDESASQIQDERDPFELYNLTWQDDSDGPRQHYKSNDEDDDDGFFQIKDAGSFIEDLLQQLRLMPLPESFMMLGEHIIGEIDADGYLRRELSEIVKETNIDIIEENIARRQSLIGEVEEADNPAMQYALSSEAKALLYTDDDFEGEVELLPQVTLDQAEKVLKVIHRLDPPGVGARTIQECLLAQLAVLPSLSESQLIAKNILTECYHQFTMKHYPAICKVLNINEETLKEGLEAIKALNPKPGSGTFSSQSNTVIPDFIITKNHDGTDLLIQVNDGRIPALQLNKLYEKLKKEARIRKFNAETKDWLRRKYDDAQFMIKAISKRKQTMLHAMTYIADKQRDFFFQGASGLKPLIYKDVADVTGLDISTVCRIVNGKYAQTDFGTFELRYFFSEALPTDDGDEVSTTVIKDKIKEMIDTEDKSKPLSDDKISKDLKKIGFNVARRTVAKYREQLKLPVARLRKEL